MIGKGTTFCRAVKSLKRIRASAPEGLSLPQLVEMVKFTVILACVSTASSPT